MCGIAGWILPDGAPIEGALIRNVQRRLRHRGPDDEGYLVFRDGGVRSGRSVADDVVPAEVLLVHTRLSIIDLSPEGRQPMSSEDGRHHIIFNGEIYNFPELREELRARGHRFRTRSDTEVLLAAYREWGAGCLSRLVGMFAFAILDVAERTVFLARDFFGIKPLYYARTERGLVFASELKVLLEFPGVSRRVDPQRAFEYLAYGSCDGGAGTMLEGVRQLPAAHCLVARLDERADRPPVRYWRLDPKLRQDITFDEAAGRLRQLFLESVRFHLRSDVPVGAALSGGIDSSAIVAAMREVGGPDLEIHAFSFIAADGGLSEERWVDIVGRATGAIVHKVYAEPSEMRRELDHLVEVQDEPFGGTSIYAQHRVFRAAHEAGIKVMLDGQGADELLAGYRIFAAPRLASLIARGRLIRASRLSRATAGWGRPTPLWRESLPYLAPDGVRIFARRFRARRASCPPWLNRTWFEAYGVRTEPPLARFGADRLRSVLHRALTETQLPALLRYEDRNSMAYSIESRVPFLTPALATFILSLPEEYILASDGTSKAVFRQAMRGIVPDAILDRRDKIGFATPEHAWLRDLRPWVHQVLGDGRVPPLAREWSPTDPEAATTDPAASDPVVWRALNLQLWCRKVGATFQEEG